MKTLFLDTASKENLLALCSDAEVLSLRKIAHRGDTELIPALEAMLQEAELQYKDLTHLACIIGPGGFTSLRVGVTTINTLRMTLDIPATGIHLADFWSARVKPEWRKEHNFLWLHSTRRTHLFVKGFGGDGTITPVGTFTMEEAAQLQGPYVGELIPEHAEMLQKCVPVPDDVLLPLQKFLPQFLGELPYGKADLAPWYGRGAD